MPSFDSPLPDDRSLELTFALRSISAAQSRQHSIHQRVLEHARPDPERDDRSPVALSLEKEEC